MVTASQLRTGMAIKFEGQRYKVVAAEYHGGQGKMGGVTHTRLQNLDTRTFWEHSFRSDLKLEEIALERQALEFLYADGDQCCFMNPETYEQTEVAKAFVGDPLFLDSLRKQKAAALVTAAQNEVNNTTADFVPFVCTDTTGLCTGEPGLSVFHSHFTPTGVAGTPHNGNTSSAESGGDVHGAVFTNQADLDYHTDTGLELVKIRQ